MPTYQADAVKAYLSNPKAQLPDASKFNASGRAYPDVSALGGTGTPYCVYFVSGVFSVAGTSASAPVVAAIFARLNGLRLSAGKPPLGFLNPWIYQNADAFFDVVSGVNKGRGDDGFTAVKGWDPASGVGTPNFAALVGRV